MGYMCDFCGEQKSMVYCRSDTACLCLSCDWNVHSANSLSKRHQRTLLCEKCNSQPASVRCIDEKLSLCQNCYLITHDGISTSASMHKRQTISCYSGCPSAAELTSLWLSVFDISPSMSESTCEKEMVMMSISENSTLSSEGLKNCKNLAKANASRSTDKPNAFGGPSSIREPNSAQNSSDQLTGSENASLEKPIFPGTSDLGLCDEGFLGDFIMDEVDLALENYEELFGVTLNHSEELFENGGIDSLFGVKDIPAADSKCQDAVAAEGASAGLINSLHPACSDAAPEDSVLSTKTEPIICFTSGKAHSSLSFSVLSGKNSAGDTNQGCGSSSSMHLTGELSPWSPPYPDDSLQSASRSNAVMRYKEKRKTRKFEKRVRYASRKARADVRKRVKGRFIKAGDAYDFDPLSQTRSC